MNDPIRYMLVGAVIAASSAAVGGAVVGWSVSQAASVSSRNIQPGMFPGSLPNTSVARLKVPAQTAASILPPGQFTLPQGGSAQPPAISFQQPGQSITIPPRPGGATNVAFHPTAAAGRPAISYSQFQKVQELPEVKKAREEFMEAQKRFSETMKKAVEKTEAGTPKTGGGSQAPVISIQKAAGT